MLKMIIHLRMLGLPLFAFLDVCLCTTGDGVRNDVRTGGAGDDLDEGAADEYEEELELETVDACSDDDVELVYEDWGEDEDEDE